MSKNYSKNNNKIENKISQTKSKKKKSSKLNSSTDNKSSIKNTNNNKKNTKKQQTKKQHAKNKNTKAKKNKNYFKVQRTDQFLKIINDAQINKKAINVYVEDEKLYPTIENILRDLDLDYEYTTYYKQPVVRIFQKNYDFNGPVDFDKLEDDFFRQMNI